MEDPKYDKEVDTLAGPIPPEIKALADNSPLSTAPTEKLPATPNSPNIDTHTPVTLKDLSNVHSGTRTQTGRILAALSAGILIGGAGVGYGLLHKKTDAAHVEAQPSATTSSSSEVVTEDKKPTTPEELRATMKKFGVKAKPESFSKKGTHLSTVMFIPNDPTDTSSQYTWAPIDSKKFEQATLIATMVSKPEYRGLVKPSKAGVQPTIIVADEENPTISYYMYECSQHPNEKARGGSIVFQNPANPQINLSTVGFTVPLCKDETIPVK